MGNIAEVNAVQFADDAFLKRAERYGYMRWTPVYTLDQISELEEVTPDIVKVLSLKVNCLAYMLTVKDLEAGDL